MMDRLLHGYRRPLSELGFRGWTVLVATEVAFVGQGIQDITNGAVAGIAWIALAAAEGTVFGWYVRRPVRK